MMEINPVHRTLLLDNTFIILKIQSMSRLITIMLIVSIFTLSCGAPPPDPAPINEAMANLVLATESFSVIIDEYGPWSVTNKMIADAPEDFASCKRPVPQFLVDMFDEGMAVDFILCTCLAESRGVAPDDYDRESVLGRWKDTYTFDPLTVSEKFPYYFACVEALGGSPDGWQESLDLPDVETIWVPNNIAYEKKQEFVDMRREYRENCAQLITDLSKAGADSSIIQSFSSAYSEVDSFIRMLTDEPGGTPLRHPPTKMILHRHLYHPYLEVYGIELDNQLSILEE